MQLLRKAALAFAVVGLIAAPALGVIMTSHLATDAAMLAVLQNVSVVAEGRIGDRGGAATFELDLGDDTGNPAVKRQYAWASGTPEPFSIVYDDNTNVVTFTLGGETLQYSPGLSFAEIFVRTRAVDGSTSVTVDNLFLNGAAVGDQSSATGPDGLDILAISGVDLTQGFTLTGVATLTWAGSAPTQSRLAFQLKFGNAPSVPVQESTWGSIKKRFE